MGISNFFKIIFGIPIKSQTFLRAVPDDIMEGLVEKYGKEFLQENAFLKAEIMRYKEQLEKYKARDKEISEEEEIIKEIINKKNLSDKKEKEKTILWTLTGLEKEPTLFTKTNKPFKKFLGFIQKETDDGYQIFYPLIRAGKRLSRIDVYTSNPLDFFPSTKGMVSQLKGGKIDTDIDFTKDGLPVVLKDKDEIKDMMNQKVKIIHLEETERTELERRIAELKEIIKDQYSAISELKDKETDYEIEIARLQSEISHTEKDRDIHVAATQSIADKEVAMAKETAKALASVQELKVEQVLSEQLSMQFMRAVDKLQEKLKRYIPEDKYERALREIRGEFNKALEMIRKIEKPQKFVIEKESPKKEKEAESIPKELGGK